MKTNRATSAKKIFENLFMGYIKNIVIEDISFHSSKVFISKKTHQKCRTFFYSIRKSIKCGIKCKKFHTEIFICKKVIQLLVHLILMVFAPISIRWLRVKVASIRFLYHPSNFQLLLQNTMYNLG